MASKSVFPYLVVLLVLCLMMKQASAGCIGSNERGCLHADAAVALETKNRKVALGGLQEKKTELKKLARSGNGGGNNNLMGWDELRKVPSGPDPLHHNGNSPKKPRTP